MGGGEEEENYGSDAEHVSEVYNELIAQQWKVKWNLKWTKNVKIY